MSKEYLLAEKIRNEAIRVTTNGVEIGVISSLKPFILKIGDSEYDARYWRIYTPYFEEKEIETKDVVLYDELNMANKFVKGQEKERKSKIDFKKGDLVAVQQLANETAFIILCKIKEVV